MGVGRASRWAVFLVVVSCSGNPVVPTAMPDAGPGETQGDAGVGAQVQPVADSGMAPMQADSGSGLDAGPILADAGPRADAGAALDAGSVDAGVDAAVPVPVVTLAVGPSLATTGFTFYGNGSGLSGQVSDVSADEAGDVYVAGGDALYAKSAGASQFLRFDATFGLTQNCDATGTTLCPVISVAGGAAGQAVVGFQGVGTDDDNDPMWEQTSGGADVVAFSGTTLRLTRHVLIATPPGVVTESPTSFTLGRRKGRQVWRAVFNHRAGAHYGDVWMGGTHVGFSVLVGNPQANGFVDPPGQYPDSLGVWEHDHPAVEQEDGSIETGDYLAIAIDPITGDPWAANEYRAASKGGYGAIPNGWWNLLAPPYNPTNQLQSYLDVWPDGSAFDVDNPAWKDNTSAMTFCGDGTLYLGSSTLGLAARSPQGAMSYYNLPAGYGNSVTGLACDADGSLWVGLGWGGLARMHSDGTLSLLPPGFGPAFAQQAVRSIQIDSWSNPRVVYFAHLASGTNPGGVTAYSGP